MSRDTKRLAQKADYLQSVAVRLRDTDSTLYGPCATCGKTVHAGIGEAGHFVPCRHKATRYEPRNVHMQCFDCNRRLREDRETHLKFIAHVDEEYGIGTADELIRFSRVMVKLNEAELRRVCAMYMAMIDELAPDKDEPILLSEKML